MRHTFLFVFILCMFSWELQAQELEMDTTSNIENKEREIMPALQIDSAFYTADTLALKKTVEKSKKQTFLPNPTRSVWLGIICPGLGQIYNRRYWKLPILYGGFAGCFYAIGWNGKYYNDFMEAYRDIMDADPNTKSYLDVLPYGTDPESAYAKSYLNQKQNYYRKYRDLSIIVTVALYALSVIDAFVDAQLSDFDISPDLSINLQPALIGVENQPLAMGVGMKFKLKF